LIAGFWTRRKCLRKVRDGEATNDLFAFLTTEPNVIGAPIRTKGMPVILATQEEIDSRMSARIDQHDLTALLCAQRFARNDSVEG
jgi:putative SOS response-associated peptidase YedK